MGGGRGKSEGGASVQFEGDGKLRGSAAEAYAYLTCIAYSMLTDTVRYSFSSSSKKAEQGTQWVGKVWSPGCLMASGCKSSSKQN